MKLKILELCGFSAGICGVWTRVLEESKRLADKGYEVRVFSSSIVKGSDKIAEPEDKIDNILIKRFPAKKLGGESFMKWNFINDALAYSPDVIICHGYRHTHTTKALKIAEILKKQGKKCRVFLVTHAPFAREETRGFIGNIIVWFYDNFIGKNMIKKFDKVIAITRWEMPYLKKLGLNDDKIEYIPNGIPEEFFRLKSLTNEENKILFVGRIAPIKSIETAINAMPLLEDKKIIFEVVGPAEEAYLKELKELIEKLDIKNRVVFPGAIFDLKKKIEKIDSSKIFVLPSKSEGMPQALVEAMARGKIVIASDMPASRDLIEDGKNGFLFAIGSEKEFAEKVNYILGNDMSVIKEKVRKDVKKFSWGRITRKIEGLFGD